MAYQEICDEYTSLLNEKLKTSTALTRLKYGYISYKKIAGKRYAYLQYRTGGKLISEYVKAENLSKIKAELNNRVTLQERLTQIDSRLKKLEAASDILDSNLNRSLITLRRCAAMDEMPVINRRKTLAFSNAIAALEGIPISVEAEQSLISWVNGNCSFRESFMAVLRKHIPAEERTNA